MAIHDRPNPIDKIDKSSYADMYISHTAYIQMCESGTNRHHTNDKDNLSLIGCKVRVRYIKWFYPEYAL